MEDDYWRKADMAEEGCGLLMLVATIVILVILGVILYGIVT